MQCMKRAISEPSRHHMLGSTASSCMVSETVHDDALESRVCRHSGLQIARVARTMRTPTIGVRM
eukprot:4931343-Lingulodinium_polyedra.AAC.1